MTTANPGWSPRTLRRMLARAIIRWTRRPSLGSVNFGHLRTLTPISADWGFDRGTPIDRYYIERFLRRNAAHIRGRVLEVDADTYSRRFGGSSVRTVDVLSLSPEKPGVTICTDLAAGDGIPPAAFDCLIVTQTLQYVLEPARAIATAYRSLAPGGTLLVSVPGISRLSDGEDFPHYWSFTAASLRRTLETVFPAESIEVEAQGNVFAAVAFLHGIAAGELREEDLAHRDPLFEVTVLGRAWKPGPE